MIQGDHMNVLIRHMQKGDLPVAVALERQSNLYCFDVPPIGECQALEPFAWRECDFLAAIRQYKSRSIGTYDTRAYVAVSTIESIGIDLVVGSLVYEIQDDGLNILRLSAVVGDDRTRQAFIDKLIAMAQASRRRLRIGCYVSDGDWETLRFFVRLEWGRRLVPSFYPDGRDAWLVETRVVSSPPPRREAAGA
jgi:hypothetical protein